jgi:hypothetical protein
MQAASPDGTEEKDSVAWMYTATDGEPLYLLIESAPPPQDEQSLEAAATCGADEQGCIQENFALATLDDGSHALLLKGTVATIVAIIRSGIEFDLAGPLATFDRAEAVAMASQLSGA